jgi:hypothetical protein
MEYFNGKMANFISDSLKIKIYMEMVPYIFPMVMLLRVNGLKDIMHKFIKNIKSLKTKEVIYEKNVYKIKMMK